MTLVSYLFLLSHYNPMGANVHVSDAMETRVLILPALTHDAGNPHHNGSYHKV